MRWAPASAFPAIAALLCAAAARADDEAAASAYLASRGLSQAGPCWITKAEVQVRRHFEAIEGQEKRYRAARQQADAMLDKNAAVRVMLEQAEASRPATGANSSLSSSTPAKVVVSSKPETTLNSKMPDVTGLGEMTPLQTAMIELVDAQEALTLSVLYVRAHGAEVSASYQPHRSEPAVATALTRVNGGKSRLGPARDYDREPAKLTAAAQLVLTSRLPVYRESGRYRVVAILNEETPVAFSLAEHSEPTVITTSLAQSLGILPADQSPAKIVTLGARKVTARGAKIPSLRLGKHRFSDILVQVLPADAEDLAPRINPQALEGHKVELDERRMSLTITPLGEPRKK